jgi:hypothetical protein
MFSDISAISINGHFIYTHHLIKNMKEFSSGVDLVTDKTGRKLEKTLEI